MILKLKAKKLRSNEQIISRPSVLPIPNNIGLKKFAPFSSKVRKGREGVRKGTHLSEWVFAGP